MQPSGTWRNLRNIKKKCNQINLKTYKAIKNTTTNVIIEMGFKISFAFPVIFLFQYQSAM